MFRAVLSRVSAASSSNVEARPSMLATAVLLVVRASRHKAPPSNIEGRVQHYCMRGQKLCLSISFQAPLHFFRRPNFQTDTNFIHRVVGNCSFQIRCCFFVFGVLLYVYFWLPWSGHGMCWPSALFSGAASSSRVDCCFFASRCLLLAFLLSALWWQAIRQTAWCAPPCPTNRQSHRHTARQTERQTAGQIERGTVV